MQFKPVAELGARLNYNFNDLGLLELACIHKSYGNETRSTHSVATRDNERLEFLGDAVLDLVVSMYLLERFPHYSEGDLSKVRASLVNEKSLAKLARELDLGPYIWLGKGEHLTGGREKDSILASTLEAIVAAIFQDGGFAEAEHWVRDRFALRIDDFALHEKLEDFKTRLQEVVQARFKSPPRYEVVEASGPDHDKTFKVELWVNGKLASHAYGKSKKEAEQNAAREALEALAPQKP